MLDCALLCVNEISQCRYPPPILTTWLLMSEARSRCSLPYENRALCVRMLSFPEIEGTLKITPGSSNHKEVDLSIVSRSKG